jgi:fluoride ion exporter CrcB/FEX
MPTVIPASLLNMQFHSITNLALGIICFVFQVVNLYRNVSGSFLIGISFFKQIAALASSPHDVYEQIGIGFWGGIILILTALAAYKSSTGEAPLYVRNS